MDVYIPETAKINMIKGQTTVAGETVIAELTTKVISKTSKK